MCRWVGNRIDYVRVSRQLRRLTAAISGRLNEGPSGVDQVQRLVWVDRTSVAVSKQATAADGAAEQVLNLLKWSAVGQQEDKHTDQVT